MSFGKVHVVVVSFPDGRDGYIEVVVAEFEFFLVLPSFGWLEVENELFSLSDLKDAF